MKPVLLSFELPLLGQVVFPAYFSLLTVGFAFAILLTWREARRLSIDPDKIIDLNLYIIICGVLGGRVLHIVADGYFLDYINMCIAPETIRAVGEVPASCTTDAQCGPYFLCNTAAGYCHPPRDCLLALKIWRGGLAYYGGFIFALAFAVYYMRKHRLPTWRVGDLAGYAIPQGLFWGRMGCYFNGCCFGKVTHSVLGMVFPKGGAVWRHQLEAGLVAASAAAPLPVHPTQLYSALSNLAIFLFLYFVIRTRKRYDGQVTWWFVLLKALSRSVIEAFRDDDRGVLLGFISTSQILSIPLLALALFMMQRCKKASAALEPPPPEPAR